MSEENVSQETPASKEELGFRRQIVLAYGVSVALVVLFCGWTAYCLGRVQQLSQQLVVSSTENTLVWDQMVNSLERQDRCMLRLLVESSTDSIGVFAEHAMTFEAALKRAKKEMLKEEGDAEALKALGEEYARFIDAFELLHKLYLGDSLYPAVVHYNTIVQPLFLSMRDKLLLIRDRDQRELIERSKQVQRESRWAKVSVAISALFFALVGGVFLNRLNRHLMVLDEQRAKAFKQERQAKRAAESANAAKNRFLATVTHELRTPLTGILGNLEFLESERDRTPREREFLMAIRSSSKVLLHLVNDLLDLSRMEEGKLTIRERPFRLADLIDEVEAVMAPAATGKALELKTSLSGDYPEWALSDPDRLRQILLNLVGNAVKFTDKGQVTLKVEGRMKGEQECELLFEVKDTGIGVSAENLKRIFKPFQQVADFEQRTQGGAGLGLSIVRSLLRCLGTRIDVESTLGEGTRFWFSLVLKPTSAPEKAPEKTAEVDVDGVTILVAEDNPINRRVLSLQLEKIGFQVQTAENGLKALEVLKAQPVDLILMDCQMPAMDGYEATRAIRELAESEKSGITVIALTAHAIEGEFEKCIAAGMDDFVPKPVSAADLEKIVCSWLAKKASQVVKGDGQD